MKITVYTIAKNEELNVDKWFESVREADYVCVLDTGSTDNTLSKLRELGVECDQKLYNPFRFDYAKSDALKLIPEDTDVCVNVDLDEYLEPGWSEVIKNTPIKDNLVYGVTYVNHLQSDGDAFPVRIGYKPSVHKYNKSLRWLYPFHEELSLNSFRSLQSYPQFNNKLDRVIVHHRPTNEGGKQLLYKQLTDLRLKEFETLYQTLGEEDRLSSLLGFLNAYVTNSYLGEELEKWKEVLRRTPESSFKGVEDLVMRRVILGLDITDLLDKLSGNHLDDSSGEQIITPVRFQEITDFLTSTPKGLYTNEKRGLKKKWLELMHNDFTLGGFEF